MNVNRTRYKEVFVLMVLQFHGKMSYTLRNISIPKRIIKLDSVI